MSVGSWSTEICTATQDLAFESRLHMQYTTFIEHPYNDKIRMKTSEISCAQNLFRLRYRIKHVPSLLCWLRQLTFLNNSFFASQNAVYIIYCFVFGWIYLKKRRDIKQQNFPHKPHNNFACQTITYTHMQDPLIFISSLYKLPDSCLDIYQCCMVYLLLAE